MRNSVDYNLVYYLISVIACCSIIHNSIGLESCTNNTSLGNIADWKCLSPKDCRNAWIIEPSRRVSCGYEGKMCCPQPLPPPKDMCTNNPLLADNAAWSCIPETTCTYAQKIPDNRKVRCGGGKICCPQRLSSTSPADSDFDKANKIALQKCYKYAAYRYINYTLPGLLIGDPPRHISKMDCPVLRTLVYGGENALKKEFPHMALLGYDDAVTNDYSWNCGGSLISEQFILSAAHCTVDRVGNPVKWAALGLLKMRRFTNDMIGENLFRIIERFDHPSYSKKYGDDDIALYKLENPIKLSSSMRPICIHHEPSLIRTNSKVIITGWGAIGPGSIQSDILQAASIKDMAANGCENAYRNTQLLKNGFNNERMICGGDPKGEKDTCEGDSGGPMQVRKVDDWWKCVWVQIGITSMGNIFCGEQMPAIYSRISAYLPWIQTIVWPA